MTRCNVCMKDNKPNVKNCEHCGVPMLPGTAPSKGSGKTKEDDNPNTNAGSKICPQCKSSDYKPTANFCRHCKVDGHPVPLVENIMTPPPKVQEIVILTEKSSGKSLEFKLDDSGMKVFGREDFSSWATDSGPIKKEKIEYVSRKHFTMTKEKDGTYWITDNSANGTYLGDMKLAKDSKTKISSGAEISIVMGKNDKVVMAFQGK